MITLRLAVPSEQIDDVLERLDEHPAVAHLVHLPGASRLPVGDVVLCDVAREAANEVIEWLQSQGVHRSGSITIGDAGAVVSDAARDAAAAAPGEGGDALVWEELEAQVREEEPITWSFLVFMAVASIIAGIAIVLDSPILVVAAMVVGPEYGPIAALCVAGARRRAGAAGRAATTLVVGFAVAALASVVATAVFRVTGLASDGFVLTERQLTSFISHPDGMAAVVAVLAGIVGMLSLTQRRSGALVGVLVSVTTIPAVANVGVAAAYGQSSEMVGAAVQLAVNLAGLLVAGVATLLVQDRLTARAHRSRRAVAGRS